MTCLAWLRSERTLHHHICVNDAEYHLEPIPPRLRRRWPPTLHRNGQRFALALLHGEAPLLDYQEGRQHDAWQADPAEFAPPSISNAADVSAEVSKHLAP
eukprot:1673093-Amphidinium_carterae.1